ncbi:GNAT family N-acetyltransferase [Anaerocolumna sp. AGMB13020]|uniref:GNAT family N-acetyltransferase n=1 Tax=Anaerocolumna sp. AGMB13020 TaxID=3081750 RepID=UPI002953E55D|nr:GNAT family N-acetyltransferase [Anaerocolumna sp. AGMB13020]WOO36163.1 GNAT family N-acetyltransferase [Anaerocolumna sp. AGMB13020]
MLKGIIFDMDGVIIDSEPSHALAALDALKTLNVFAALDYPYGFIGSTTEHMLKTMIKDFHLDISVDDLHMRYKDCLASRINTEGYIPVPYVQQLIKHLHSQGFLLAIASSSTPEEIKSVANALDISTYFDKLVSGTTVANPKPAPDVFLKAVNELGLRIDECIIIEDSFNGVKAACAAGIPVVGYVNPNSGNQDLSKSEILIEGFEEIDSSFLNRIYQRFHNIPLTIADSKRLLIKEIPLEDIPLLFNMYRDPIVNKFLPQIQAVAHNSLEDFTEKHKAYIDSMYHFYGFGLWGVYLKDSGCFIGQCGFEQHLLDGEDVIELGFLLDSKYQGFGYGLEAVTAVINYANLSLDIKLISALTNPLNQASVSLLLKAGFRYIKTIMKDKEEYSLYTLTQ